MGTFDDRFTNHPVFQALEQLRTHLGAAEEHLSTTELREAHARLALVADYFRPSGEVPGRFSRVVLEGGESDDRVELVLKIEPSELIARLDGDWKISYQKDLRLPGLVSVLKSAHLTLLTLLGYRYVFSAAGRYVGYDVLGKFVEENAGKDRAAQLKNAASHFRRFTSIVRPITDHPEALSGTISDNVLHFCYDGDIVWAFLVLVRTGEDWHGVLLPTMESPRAIDRYLRFIDAPSPSIRRRLARFDEENEKWLVQPQDGFVYWPGGVGW